MEKNHTVIVIGGPTASGKTALAIELAQKYGAEIISADSRQCYKELNIGVARPSEEELQLVPHHFIASHSILEIINAGVFESLALQKIEELSQTKSHTIVVGGTGLYIKALCEGIDPMPETSEEIRIKNHSLFLEKGISWLQKEVQTKDPHFWQIAEKQNPQRLLRALDFFESTGRSIQEFRTLRKVTRPFKIEKKGIELPRIELYERINQRVDVMIRNGLVNEVEELKEYKHLNALQTVGYKEIFEYFDGKMSLSQAIEKIKQNTRNYAKRQLTWFKKDTEFNWKLLANN